jgi:glycosyltransferase involved in cell wall biosynthesis
LALAGIHAPREIRSLAGPDIAILGAVPDAEELMRRSAVVLAPVRIGGGMRMKVLHAMALAKPVVTTTRGTEGLNARGREPPLAVADDAEGIARATARLLADPVAGERLGAAARDYVSQHHTPSAYADRFEAVVARAAARRSPAPADRPS